MTNENERPAMVGSKAEIMLAEVDNAISSATLELDQLELKVIRKLEAIKELERSRDFWQQQINR